MAVGARNTPLLTGTEYVLGMLWALGPTEQHRLIECLHRVRSPLLSRKDTEIAIRSMIHQGILEYREGRLYLKTHGLHPDAVRLARAAAKTLMVTGALRLCGEPR